MWGFIICKVRVDVHLESDVVISHARKERLEPFDVLSLCLLCDGLQNTLMTATKTDNYASDIKHCYMLLLERHRLNVNGRIMPSCPQPIGK